MGMPTTKQAMSPDEFEKKMAGIDKLNDTEERHGEMDDLMCEVLTALGYGAGVNIFKHTDKWYA